MPELRFPEFSGEWEEKKFSSVCSVEMGQSPSSKNYTENSQDTILIQGNADLKQGKVVPRIYTTEITKTSKPGDIILTVRAPVGDIAINDQFACIGRGVCSIEGNNFVYHLLKFLNEKNVWKRLSQGSTFEAIGSSEIKNLMVNIPSNLEQEKIASFLSKVDEKIEKLEKKQELWETYKKGMMQKIFSQELRFKDENGEDYPDWEEKKLGEIMIEGKLGGNYKNSEGNNGVPLIKMGNIGRGVINLNKVQYLDETEIFDKNDILKEGDLLFNTRNTLELVGKVAIWRNELPFALYNSNLLRMKFNDTIESSNKFMNYLFNTKKSINQLRSFATGTTSVAAIYGRDLKRLNVELPSVNEQEKIASFLSIIDQRKEIFDNERQKIYEFKKGLLQQMFC